MKPEYTIVFSVAILFLAPVMIYALPSSGSLYLSIPNSSVKCVNILLPDDAGYFGQGKVDYVITMEPEPSLTWSDFSYQEVGVDSNNTAKIPICFSSFGRPVGNCSEPFEIRIRAPGIVDKVWHGGACASKFADFDTHGGTADSAASGLSDVEVFSVGLRESARYTSPGGEAGFMLYLESQAELDITVGVEADNGLVVTPLSAAVSTGEENEFHEIALNATAPDTEGSYDFTVTATASDCGSGSMCSRHATGKLVVGDGPQQGFTVSLFPENINTREPEPVTYRLAIINMGESDQFTITSSLPEGVDTTFVEDTITVGSGDHRTLTFTVTPSSVSSSYELDFTVASSAGVEKPVTAYISTNEMLTDSLRSLESINQYDSEAASDAQAELDSWYSTYQSSSYGSGLQEYSGLRDSLEEARKEAADSFQGSQETGTGEKTGNEADAGERNYTGTSGPGDDLNPIYVILPAAALLLGVAFVIVRKKGRSKEEWDQEIGEEI